MNTDGKFKSSVINTDPLIDLLEETGNTDNTHHSDPAGFHKPHLELNLDNEFYSQNYSQNSQPRSINGNYRNQNTSNFQDDDEDMIDITPIENPFANPDATELRKSTAAAAVGSSNSNYGNGDREYYSFEKLLRSRTRISSDVASGSGADEDEQNLDLRTSGGYYEDFETIDWVKDLNRDRQRHKELSSRKKSVWSGVKSLLDSGTGWFCVLLVGLATGATAGVVDIGSTWMFDLKLGVCREAFWLNKEQCCWTPNNTNFDDPECEEWYPWSRMLIGKPLNTADGYFVGYLSFVAFALLFAGLAVRLVVTFAPYACGSGIPEIKTILSGFVIRGYLGKWTLLVKSLGMILAVSAGLSLGKEGPMVHMAVCWGNCFAYLFPKYGNNEAKKREIMSASAAAGVAVAFGAPIGGVLFSLEEASYYFPLKTMFRSFFCAMVAANVLRLMNPFGKENLVMFYLDYKAQWHAIELIPFALLGVFGGLFGIVFNKANLWVCAKRKSSKFGRYPCTEVIIVTLLTAMISFPQEYLRINSSELIRILVGLCGAGDNITLCDYKINMSDPKSYSFGSFPAGSGVSSAVVMLLLALFCKVFLTIFTFGVKVPCGLFIPSMTVGAIMGRLMGVAVEQWAVSRQSELVWLAQMCKSGEPCINPGLYAMVGAAACLGGVTRMTVSLVVIMLELTGGSNYILPLMVATMVSKWTGDRLCGGIYDEHIRLNNYPYLTANQSDSHTDRTTEVDVTASDIMKPGNNDQPLKIITQNGMTLVQIEELLRISEVNGFPVVVSLESHYLVGFVARRDLEWAIRKAVETPGYGIHSSVSFSETSVGSAGLPSSGPLKTLYLKNILDLFPVTVTDQTPVETVLDFFIKLGLRQVIVTQNGRLRGIITKKDVLRYLNQSRQNTTPGPRKFCF